MKKLVFIVVSVFLLASCGDTGTYNCNGNGKRDVTVEQLNRYEVLLSSGDTVYVECSFMYDYNRGKNVIYSFRIHNQAVLEVVNPIYVKKIN